MKHFLLCLGVACVLLSEVQAQVTFPILKPQQVDLYEYTQYMMLPENQASGIKRMSELPNAIFRYRNDKVNASMLNRNLMGEAPFPNEAYTLKLPDMTGMPDTLVMLVGLPAKDGQRTVNAVIIGNLRDRLAYFVDTNHNFDFTDDDDFIVFHEKERFTKVSIHPQESEEKHEYILFDLGVDKEYLKTLGIYLIEPTKHNRQKAEAKYKVPYLSWDSRLNWQLAFTTGSGEQYFSYNTTQGENKRYSAAIDAVSRFSTNLSYAFRNLNVGVQLALDANQIGREEQYLTDYSDPEEAPQKVTHYNIGNWSRIRVMYGIFAEYDIRLIRNSYLAPYFSLFRYHHLRNENFSGYANEVSRDYAFNDLFTNRIGQQFGAKLKFPMSEKVLVVLDVGYTKNNFDLQEGFILEPYDGTSISTYYNTFNYGLGCQFLLFTKAEELSKTKPIGSKIQN